MEKDQDKGWDTVNIEQYLDPTDDETIHAHDDSNDKAK